MKRSLVALCLLFAVLHSCGDDGVVFVSANLGTVASDPDCGPGGGRFDLRDEQGFVLLVIIDSSTTIFLSRGAPGNCTDLVAGAPVQVRGSNNQGTIDAQEVRLR